MPKLHGAYRLAIATSSALKAAKGLGCCHSLVKKMPWVALLNPLEQCD
jgi:hypothetical protein